jgi:hypothetical protein
VLYGAAALSRSDRWKKGYTTPPLGTITARPRNTDQKEDGVDRGPNKPKPKRGSAFEKLQSEREAKGVEEDLERNVEEREERKQIRQEEREERKRERERGREKARGQEESS